PGCQKACVLPENPASYRVVRTKSYLFNKALSTVLFLIRKSEVHNRILRNHLFLLGYGRIVAPGESNRTVRLSAG
ncbi:TPA: hypothetical protein ACQVLY_004937, partial [Serratia marcescens]